MLEAVDIKQITKNCNIKSVKGEIKGLKIAKLCCNTDDVVQNSMFFCLIGNALDGHNFAQSAVDLGASVLVVERFLQIDIPQILVTSVRKAMAKFASNFYGNPKDKLCIIGVTGTNGKTTVTYMIENILKTAGKKVGVIGTIGIKFGDKIFDASLTTPDPIDLHRVFADMVKKGIEFVVMEVSAHAIYYEKIYSINFSVGILTNVTHDHLDFFGSFNKYFDTKRRFFTENFCKTIILNIDDKLGNDLFFKNDKCKNLLKFSYGLKNKANFFAFNIKFENCKTEYILKIVNDEISISTKLIGEFNIYNTMAAAGCCHGLGIKSKDIETGINTMDFVPGRVNVLKTKTNKMFVVDYAHTPDGLINVLKTVRGISKGKVVCVFGCGGNRDALKRPEMGKIAVLNSDFVIITSDNPRFENPRNIIDQIKKGASEVADNFTCVENRKDAIKLAYNMIKSGDFVVICGKGVENYMDIMGKKIPYSDFDVIREIIEMEK